MSHKAKHKKSRRRRKVGSRIRANRRTRRRKR